MGCSLFTQVSCDVGSPEAVQVVEAFGQQFGSLQVSLATIDNVVIAAQCQALCLLVVRL